MALGPQAIAKNRQPVIDEAEQLIDTAILKSKGTRVTINTSLLKITEGEWKKFLAPKYREAGWRTADWTWDQRDGDFIDLNAEV